ncbi:DUF6042 family protein [Streptomyces sp. NPDC007172]|uniref:DUF6042 family protein n=1 Tax=Streptomyces sp. NPDC007172 TaxID=3364776 RepID=UPI0036C598F6
MTWGLASREETPVGTRWSMPAVLPLPGDLPPLDADLAKRLDSIRWSMRNAHRSARQRAHRPPGQRSGRTSRGPHLPGPTGGRHQPGQ